MTRVTIGLCIAGAALSLMAQAILSEGAANTGLTAVGTALFLLLAALTVLGSERTQV